MFMMIYGDVLKLWLFILQLIGGQNEMKLSLKLIEKHQQRKTKFEATKKYVDKKTAFFAKNVLSTSTANQPETDGQKTIDPYGNYLHLYYLYFLY
jgi:hypothetical protein